MSVDVGGPRSRTVVEVKNINNGVPVNILRSTVDAWSVDERPNLSGWRKCFVSKFGFTGTITNAPILVQDEQSSSLPPQGTQMPKPCCLG